MRRRTVGAFIALALLAGGTAQAVPPATGSPILGADTVVYSDRSASMTVQVPQAFHLNPWPKLTLIVSLEAIFLSTFVMIGQNRQASFQQAKADHDFVEQEQELKTNTDITSAIHALTKEIHARVTSAG